MRSWLTNRTAARTTLLLLDAKPNRHSLNALVGALETDRTLDDLELRLSANQAQLAQSIAETLALGRKPIVGISFTTAQCSEVEGILQRCIGNFSASDNMQVFWVAGGPHPTADPEGTLRLGFNAIVRGEGEATLLDLIQVVACDGDVSEISGLGVRGPSGEIRFTLPRSPVDLDEFPPFPLHRRRVVGPIEITRGCPFACAYCQTSHLLGIRPRHRSVETVARYARVIRERGLRDVRVIAPNAFSYGSPDGRTLNLPALESLLSTLRHTIGPEGRLFFGTFPSEVRPEHVNDATLELVKRFASNDNLIIGAQAGSERMLERCGRGHHVADVFTAVSRTIAAGLKPHVDFIFGLPAETHDDLDETMAVLRELAAIGAVIHAHTFMPLPQTRFADAPPGRIPGRIRPLVREMIRTDKLYGVWHKQEREAKRISQAPRRGKS